MKLKQSRTSPKNAIRVTTYNELLKWVSAFAAGKFNLLIVIGQPGLQKSRLLRDAVGESACWLAGNCTALGMFIALYRHRNELAVIDDVDSLYSDRHAVRLLKTLCQTDPQKHLAWHSMTAALEREEVPREFNTTAHLAIVANEWQSLNVNISAIEDRGNVILFEPSPLEVHLRVAEWFDQQDIFDFVAQHLHLISSPSMRDYVGGSELKAAGFDWRALLLERWGLTGARLLVARLRADERFATEGERVAAFVKAGGGCQATYYNQLGKFGSPIDIPKIQLKPQSHKSDVDSVDILDLLKRRRGTFGNN